MKRFAALTLVLMLAMTGALAAVHTVKLFSDQSVEKQAKALKAYIEKLSPEDRALWKTALQDMLDNDEETAPQGRAADTVWVSGTGKRYHRLSTCSNMKNPREITRDEAIGRGLTPCKKCRPR